VGIRIIVFANLFKRGLEQVANRNALTDMKIAERVKVDAARIA
jgi:hypothetical protein